MSFLGVSIDISTPKLCKLSCSGIKICDHFVFTHGSIVWNFIKEYITKNIKVIYKEKNFQLLQSDITSYINDTNSKFTVVLPNPKYDDGKINEKNISTNTQTKSVKFVEGHLEHVFVFPSLVLDFIKLLSRREMWKFDKSKDSKNAPKEQRRLEDIYLSSFLVLRIKDGGSLCTCLEEFEGSISYPKKGTTVFIDGCPFGIGGARSVFLNSLSKGIVSNKSEGGNILLADARCILGCEGAPVYSVDQKIGVCGIVLSPFCWLRGEWIGLTFIGALGPLVKYMKECAGRGKTLGLYPIQTCVDPEEKKSECVDRVKLCSTIRNLAQEGGQELVDSNNVLDLVDSMEKCIVRVMCSNSVDWGTGVVVSRAPGIVVTCAHVIKGAKNKTVDMILWNGRREKGIVLYETNPCTKEGMKELGLTGDSVWDLAVIRLLHPPSHSLPLAKEIPAIGTPVLIGGHPLFEATALSTPTFSLGNLAKVCSVDRKSFKFENEPEPEVPKQIDTKQNINEIMSKNSSDFSYLDLNVDFVSSKWRRFSIFGDVIPVFVQTTCAVYCGVSGGPVVAMHPVKGPVIIGIMASCARDTVNKVCFPHVNMASPSFLLSEAIDRYIRTGDINSFAVLKIKSSAGLSLWTLEDIHSKL